MINMPKKQRDQTQPLLAMVALNTPSLPPLQDLLANLKAIPGIAVDLDSARIRGDTFVFGLGNDNAAVALMPAPIPWPDLEGPCATAWWWPEATERMKGRSTHVLIALVGAPDNPIQRHIGLTRLTVAVASLTDAAGIYWGGGRLVYDPQAFIEEAQDASPENLPIPLWVDFRIETMTTDRFGCSRQG